MKIRLNSGKPIATRAAAAALAMFFLIGAGCEITGKRDGAQLTVSPLEGSGDGGATAGLIAFRTTAHPWLNQNCSSCHGVSGAIPLAADDAVRAFASARGYFNLEVPAASRLLAQATNGHCGSALCQGDGSALSAALARWKADWSRTSLTPKVRWVSTSHSLSEATGAVSLTLALDYPAAVDLRVPFAVSGSARSMIDHNLPANGEVVFAAGSVQASLSFSILQDAVHEPNETLVIRLAAGNGVDLSADDPALTVTVIDDEAALSAAFTAASQSVAETAGSATATITLTAASESEILIPYTVSGTGANPADHLLVAGSARIPALATSATISFAITNDATYEADKTVILTLGNAAGISLGATRTHTVTITNDDAAPVIQFSAATQTQGEGAGRVTIGLAVSAASELPISVPYTVSGTSTAGSDHNLVAGTISLPALATAASLSLDLVDDAINEPAETVIVSLGTPTGATRGANATHTLTITDNDALPSVQFTSASQSVAESGSATATVSLSAAAAQDVTVTFTVGGTAANPSDHGLSGGTATIPAGLTSRAIAIPIVADTIYEPAETVILTLTAVNSAATLGATRVHTVTINNNDAQPTAQFATAAQSVSDAVGNVTVSATLSNPSSAQISLPFTVGGTAANPADHNLTAGNLVFAPLATSATLTFNVVPRATPGPDRTVILSLGGTSTHTVTISSSVAINVQFSTASQTVSEAVGAVTLTARLNGTKTTDVTVPYTVAGTARNPADHNLVAGTLTIAAGQTSRDLVFTANNNSVYDGNRTVIVTLGTPTGAALGATSAHTVTLTDNDPIPAIQLSAASQNVAENAGTASIGVTIDRASLTAITVPYTVSGTALNPSHHSLASGTFTIAAGATTGSVSFNVVDNALFDGNRTVIVALGTPTGATLGATQIHTATLTDNETAPSVQFNGTSASVGEGAGTTQIGLTLSGASAAAIQVPYVVTGTASNPADHNLASGTLSIAAGATTASLSLTIVDDAAYDPGETVIVTLGAPTGAGLGTNRVFTVTISDNEAQPAVRFALASQSLAESAGTVQLGVSLSAASASAASVPYTISGTASQPGDHNLAAGTLSFPAGTTSRTIAITLANDAIHEASETVIVTLGTPTGVTLGTPAAHTLTIQDDDAAPSVSFSAATQSVGEAVGTVTVNLALSAASGLAVSVPYAVDGTATNPADHNLAASGTVSIAAGATTGSVSFAIANDASAEPSDELVRLTIGTPTGASRGATFTHSLTIIDDDPMPTQAQEAFRGSVYAYTRANCIGCHSTTQAPLHASSNIGNAYLAAKNYVNFADVPNSILVVRTMNGHGGCGAACMTDGTAMTALINQWKPFETSPAPSPSASPAPSPSPSGSPGGGTVLYSDDTRVRMLERRATAAKLIGIFGTSTATTATVKAVADALISTNIAWFGGPCDFYANDCSNDHNASLAATVPRANAVRASYVTRACERVTANDAVINGVITAVGGSSSAAPTDAQIRAAYDLFFPARALDDASLTELRAVANAPGSIAAFNGSNIRLEGWRYLWLTLCMDQAWQAP